MKNILFTGLGVYLFTSLLGSLTPWLYPSYEATLDAARSPDADLRRRDFLIGSMYIRYLGLLGGFIGVLCAVISTFAPLWADSYGEASWWSEAVLAQWSILVAGIILLCLLKRRGEAALKIVMSFCSFIALFIWPSDVQPQPLIVWITLLTISFAWACSIANEFLLNSFLPKWRAITDNLYLIPVSIVFYIGMSKIFVYSSRVDLAVLEQAFALYAYFGWLAVIFLIFSLSSAWTGTNYETVKTENSPVFNAGHNGLFLIAALTVGIFAALLTRSVITFQGNSMGALITITLAIIVALIKLVIDLMNRSVGVSEDHIKRGAHNQVLLNQLNPKERKQWKMVLIGWIIIDILLLILILAIPWVVIIREPFL